MNDASKKRAISNTSKTRATSQMVQISEPAPYLPYLPYLPYQLLPGKCLSLLPTIESGSVHLIVCDLPYGITAAEGDIRIQMEPLWEEYMRVLKPGGIVILFGVQPFTSELVMSNLPWFRYELIWNRHNVSGFLDAKKRPLQCHENVLVFYERSVGVGVGVGVGKGSERGRRGKQPPTDPPARPTYRPIKTLGPPNHGRRISSRPSPQAQQVYKGAFYNVPSDTSGWKYPRSILPPLAPVPPIPTMLTLPTTPTLPTHIPDPTSPRGVDILDISTTMLDYPKHPARERLHPFEKPVPLLQYLVRTFSNPVEVVLDNCFGSCSTGEACLRTGRRFIGMEMLPKYFKVGVERMQRVHAELEMQPTLF